MDLALLEAASPLSSYAVLDKRGEQVFVVPLEEHRHQQLIEAYLAYRPRNCFQGLPPLRNEVCAEWVRQVIARGINLVAVSPGDFLVGHVALFPLAHLACELLVVVWPQFQDRGIGTQLVDCGLDLSRRLGFEEVRLEVEAVNVRARRVYEKCGFAYRRHGTAGEVTMAQLL